VRNRAKGDEKLFQLLERFGHPGCRPGGHGSVERLLRGIEIVNGQQRLATFFLESHRGDDLAVITFLIRPDEARVRCYLEVPPEEVRISLIMITQIAAS
jgi:hypothetical protein